MSDERERVQGTETQYGCCKFCGQSYAFQTVGEASEERLTEWATEKCDCTEAKEERKLRMDERKAYQNIQKLFKDSKTAQILMQAVWPILTCEIDSIAIDIGGGVKASMGLNKNGRIKVQKRTTLTDTAED